MTMYTEAKATVLTDMAELNQRMALLIKGLDALDRIDGCDLYDQVATMLKAQEMMNDVIERAFGVNGQ